MEQRGAVMNIRTQSSRRVMLATSWIAVLAIGCSSPMIRNAGLEPDVRTSALFARVAEVLNDSSAATLRQLGYAGATLAVDPRPFSRRAMEMTSFPWSPEGAFDTIPSAVLQDRRRELVRLGIPEGDITRLKDCPGVMVPAPGSRNCPARPVLIAVVSLPDTAGHHYLVQVYVAAADSNGRTGLVTSYSMQHAASGWKLIDRGLRIIIE